MLRSASLIVCVLTACGWGRLSSLPTAQAEDWPAFRGPQGNGISRESQTPLEWSKEKNVKWRVTLPGPGNSSPIVSNGRVFLTQATEEGRNRSLYCFDRKDGKQLWVKTINFGKVMPTHKTNPYEASSPVADGERVVAWHGSAGLYCYDFNGKELWKQDTGEARHIWGYAASPIIHRGRVILNHGPGERTFMAAYDLDSGKELWKTPEPGGKSGEGQQGGYVGSWSTPIVVTVDGQKQIICSMPTRVNAYDPETGKIIWYVEGLGNQPRGDLAYSSVTVENGVGVALGGFNGPGIGFKLGGQGNMTDKNLLWRDASNNPQRIGSGVAFDGVLYQANAGPGTIECLDLKTGEQTWQSRGGGGGSFWGSVVLAAGRLYVTNQAGTTIVFKPNAKKFELLASNALHEESNSTPAISDGEIFVRTFQALYCVAEK